MSDECGRDVFFVDEQICLLHDILDQIIPRRGDREGAGELGVAAYLDGVVGGSPKLRALFSRGLMAVELTAGNRFDKGFSDLSNGEKTAVLKEVEEADREFFKTFVQQTYNGYYTHKNVRARLGADVRPPQPQGYLLEKGDLSGLEKVKERGPIYR